MIGTSLGNIQKRKQMDILHSGSSQERKLHWIFSWDFYLGKGWHSH